MVKEIHFFLVKNMLGAFRVNEKFSQIIVIALLMKIITVMIVTIVEQPCNKPDL